MTRVLTSRDAGHALQGAVIPGLQQARQGYKDREVRLTGERFRVENRLADLVEAERCQFQENLQLEHRVGTQSPAWALVSFAALSLEQWCFASVRIVHCSPRQA
jgi:hypothetical protein